MREITSSQNSVVKGMRALKEARVRAQQGRMLVEGEKMIREAVSCGLTPFETLIDAQNGKNSLPLPRGWQAKERRCTLRRNA